MQLELRWKRGKRKYEFVQIHWIFVSRNNVTYPVECN